MTRGFAYLSAYTFETLLIKAPLITLHRCNLLRIMYYDPPPQSYHFYGGYIESPDSITTLVKQIDNYRKPDELMLGKLYWYNPHNIFERHVYFEFKITK